MEGDKKKDKSGKKKGVLKKKDFFGRDGLWGDRPSDPFQMALKAALWTIGTSGKVLYDCKRTALDLYRNLVSTEVSTNNKKIVLLFVLLYCPGSNDRDWSKYGTKGFIVKDSHCVLVS